MNTYKKPAYSQKSSLINMCEHIYSLGSRFQLKKKKQLVHIFYERIVTIL